MKYLILLILIFNLSCSKTPADTTTIPVDIRKDLVGYFNFKIGEHYTYMYAETVNGKVIEYIQDVYRETKSISKIYSGSISNQLIVDWENDSISYSYFNKKANTYQITNLLPIYLNESGTFFEIDSSLETRIVEQYIDKDSFFVHFKGSGFNHNYYIGGRRK